MTGFARVRKQTADGEIVFSLKSVNHRGLDLHFHMPPELDPLEAAVRGVLKGGVARGHIQIHVALNPNPGSGVAPLNRQLLDAWMAAFREASKVYGLDREPDLNAALRVPGMLSTSAAEDVSPETEKALLAAAAEAVTMLNGFREREGAAIGTEMRQRCENICELVAKMEDIRTRAVPAFQKRLRERMNDLLHGTGIEPQRLAQEAALLADRSDISEELVRLKTHAAQLRAILDGAGEMGKRLDFLLQEMNRESNTVLSKTGGLGEIGLTITDLALAAKSEIDKIREQSLNLE